MGSRIHSVTRLLGRDLEMDVEITQWDPPNIWGMKGSSGPMKFDNSNKFEAKDGGTLLVQSFQRVIGGFFKVAESLAIKQVQKGIESDGQTLKQLLESKKQAFNQVVIRINKATPYHPYPSIIRAPR